MTQRSFALDSAATAAGGLPGVVVEHFEARRNPSEIPLNGLRLVSYCEDVRELNIAVTQRSGALEG